VRAPIRTPLCTPFCAPRVNTCRPSITHYTMLSPIHSGTVVHSFLSFISYSKEENIMSILIAHLSHTYRKLSARNGYHYAGFFLFYLFSPPFAHHFNTRVNTCRHTYYPIITPSYYTISYSFGHSCSFFFIFHFFIKGRKHTIHSYRTLIASFVHGTAITYYPYMHSIRAPFCPPFARPC